MLISTSETFGVHVVRVYHHQLLLRCSSISFHQYSPCATPKSLFDISYKLIGSSAIVATNVEEIFELIEQVNTPLVSQHKVEIGEVEARVVFTGKRLTAKSKTS